MISKEELLKRKNDRTKSRILGIVVMILGYGIAAACMVSDSPATILGIIVAFVGIILFLRSFFHIKYEDLNRHLAEVDQNK